MIYYHKPSHPKYKCFDVSNDKLKLEFLQKHHSKYWKRITYKVRNILNECSSINSGYKKTLSLIKKECGFKSNKTIQSWKNLGYTNIEAEIEVHLVQSFLAKKNDYSKKDRTETQLGYWIKKGVSEADAKIKVKHRQNTSSKEFMIRKYGDKEGERRLQEIKKSKQKTFYSKTIEEQNRINISRTSHNGVYSRKKFFEDNPNKRDYPGILYYFKYTINNVDYWKIGITQRTFEDRWPLSKQLRYNISNVEIEKDTIYNCFNKEQEILKLYHKYRVATEITTESFNKNIKEII